jgi:hypothetical protein
MEKAGSVTYTRSSILKRIINVGLYYGMLIRRQGGSVTGFIGL